MVVSNRPATSTGNGARLFSVANDRPPLQACIIMTVDNDFSIIEALDEERLFKPFFKGDTWRTWRAFLKALFGLPMLHDECAIYTAHTGRTTPPTIPFREACLVVGRAVARAARWRWWPPIWPHSSTTPRTSRPARLRPSR
jgi:hypothetical protein